jgi:hypothetical protein
MLFLQQYRSARDLTPAGVWYERNGKLQYLFSRDGHPDYLVGLPQVIARQGLSWGEHFARLAEIPPFAQGWALVEAETPLQALEPSLVPIQVA